MYPFSLFFIYLRFYLKDKKSTHHLFLRQTFHRRQCVSYGHTSMTKINTLHDRCVTVLYNACTFVNWESNKKLRAKMLKVRIEGDVVVLSRDDYTDIFENEKLFCKIRAYICHQDQEVDWNELKARHDQLLNDVRQNKKSLPIPDHLWVYFYSPASFASIFLFCSFSFVLHSLKKNSIIQCTSF